jgi:hypothetical protein
MNYCGAGLGYFLSGVQTDAMFCYAKYFSMNGRRNVKYEQEVIKSCIAKVH